MATYSVYDVPSGMVIFETEDLGLAEHMRAGSPEGSVAYRKFCSPASDCITCPLTPEGRQAAIQDAREAYLKGWRGGTYGR